MEEHLAKELMKRPRAKNVAWCRALHQVFSAYLIPKWKTVFDFKLCDIYFGLNNWLRNTIKIRLWLQPYSSRAEVSDKFRQRKLVSRQASTLYPPIRHQCKPGWNQNKQLSTWAFETNVQIVHILTFIEIFFQFARTRDQMISATRGCPNPFAQAINSLKTFVRKVVTPIGINCLGMLSW